MQNLVPLALGALLLGTLGGCDDPGSTTIHSNCTKGRVIGGSCNGTLIQLTSGDLTLGKTITYTGNIYYNVVGTYSVLPANTAAGTELTFQLRSPTEAEAAPRPCLAIYQEFDVPQLVVENVGCQR
ncbi:hypothetical protein [Hymenobacter sp. UYP22]|uniref:hypothetical protein n=1 Tax=Hymenobacter sp. UYP22 TaxID=3156348 RepID=UPI0033980999